jgi:S1-C subfamily serine protease
MKKPLFILLSALLLANGARAADKIDNIENEMRNVLDRVSPSLVKVVAENARKYVATGIAMENELVITTTLVTQHPFAKLTVETTSGETIAASIAGQDPRSGLALLRLEKRGPQPISQAGPAEVGNWVALVGLFYDRFPSIFQGIISSLGENALILNAPVAPGSAGGAVVNKKGELLGVIRGSIGFSVTPEYTFKDHSATIVVSSNKNESGNLCFAIPVQQVRRIADILKTAGSIVPGWLGVTFTSDSNQVYDVVRESPSAKAGIARGDRVEEIGGRPIGSFRDIASALKFRQAGEKVRITVRRAGRPLRLDVELAAHPSGLPAPPAFPEAPLEIPEAPESGPPLPARQVIEMPGPLDLDSALPRTRNYVIEFDGARQLGVDVLEITGDLGRKFAIPEGYGLMISHVNEGSAASRAGLKAGDIVVRANGTPVPGASDLRKALNVLKENEAVRIDLYRDGQLRKFSFVPDKSEMAAWNVRQFSLKMEELKDAISDEAKLKYVEEIRKLKRSRERTLDDLQKDRQASLRKLREESQKLAAELKALQEKGRLSAELFRKYGAALKRIADELGTLREKIDGEGAAQPGAGPRQR